jgi:uncharacterized protein YkwD
MPVMTMSIAPRPRTLPILAALIALLLLAAGPMANPRPAYAAATDESIEAQILALVNNARANRGIAALQTGAKLVDFAGDRAARMASTGVLKHPRCLPCKLDRRGITYSTYGETIAWTFAPWGSEAAKSLFRTWKNSPPHWSLLMSPKYHRIGIGVALRSNNSTWAAAVMTD